jgi:Spy/CpxP family protein refolding chaperone
LIAAATAAAAAALIFAATAAAAETAVEVLPPWPLGPVDVRGMSKQNAKHCKLLH